MRVSEQNIGHPAGASRRKKRDNVVGMQETKREQRSKTVNKPRTEPPWNVVLHNDWNNSMPHVVLVLKKIIPGMTYKKATKIMWEAHSKGKATVKRCHKELAELYKEQLQDEGLSTSIEPASSS